MQTLQAPRGVISAVENELMDEAVKSHLRDLRVLALARRLRLECPELAERMGLVDVCCRSLPRRGL